MADVNYLPHSDAGMTLLGVYTENERSTTSLPVTGSSSGAIRTVAVMSVGVRGDDPRQLRPGDLLHIYGRIRVTNDIGPETYTVGVGVWWDGYDIDDGVAYADKSWISDWLPDDDLGKRAGMNVDRSVVHHLLLTLDGDWWQVPPDFPPGHRVAVAWRANAASTAWQRNGGGDVITVDNYVAIATEHWRR